MILTPSAINDYHRKVRKSAVRLPEAERDLRKSLESPLFSCAGPEGATLLGAIDGQEHRYLALLAADGNVVAVGPYHHWKEAKDSWRSVGWNPNRGRPIAGESNAPKGQPPKDNPLSARISVRVDPDVARWVERRGGADWVRLVIEREMARDGEIPSIDPEDLIV